MGKTNKGVIDKTNIKAGIKLDGANKNEISRANKSKISEANIKTDKKTGANTVASIDNNRNGANKVINWHISLINLIFAAFTITNNFGDFNLVIPKKNIFKYYFFYFQWVC